MSTNAVGTTHCSADAAVNGKRERFADNETTIITEPL